MKRPSIRSKLNYTLVRDLHIYIDHLESQLKEREEILQNICDRWSEINYVNGPISDLTDIMVETESNLKNQKEK